MPHHQVVFTIPKMLRIFFKFKRLLLGDLCRCALNPLVLRMVEDDMKRISSKGWADIMRKVY